MTQTHSIHFKWIDGAGTQNNISWVTDQGTFTDSHPDINGGADTTVQRLSISVPSTITLPTLTAPTVTYTVTNNGMTAYTFSGPRTGDNPNIGPLRRGGTYTFDITATGHPFYFTTDNGTNFSAGTYFGEYTDGVTGSRTDSGTVTFTVPNDAPDTLYYQCGNHSMMRGAITIKDLAVETNINGNYVVYAQHDQEGHKTPIELRPIPSLVNQMCLVYDASTNTFVPQDLATYVENTPSFENKIREVAGTAELVVEDGTTVITSVNVYDDSTYLPLTNNNAGDQAFATDTNILYIWDGTTWQQAGTTNTDDLNEGSTNLFYTDARVDARISNNFVLPAGTTAQRPVTPTVGTLRYNTDTATVEKYTGTGWYSLNTFPTITNISYASGADATDPLGGETVTVTGTNFEIGSTLLLDSVSISYSVVNDTEITFTTPAKTAGDYDLVLISPGGSQATSVNAISYNGVPAWTTSAGSLGSFNEGDSVSISLVASETDSGSITYTIVSGSLPTGLSLSGNTISGTAPAELSDTSYPFTVRATDDENQFTDRNFTITVVASATYAVAPSGATAYTADVTANGSSAYTFSNATDRDGAVSGDNDSINILAGDTITITNNASSSHPIYFKTSQGTGTGNLVTGATGQGASGGSTISWTPTVPGTYYYQCSNHSAMNGTIVVSAVNVNEGSAFTFDVTTTNVPDSTTLYWTIDNITTENADFNNASGSFTITSNAGSFSVTPVSGDIPDSGETFTVSVRLESVSGTVVATSNTITITETSSAAFQPALQTISGSQSITLPSGILAGDLILWTQYTGDSSNDTLRLWPGEKEEWVELAFSQANAVDTWTGYKIADGTEGGTSVSPTQGSAYVTVVQVIRGADIENNNFIAMFKASGDSDAQLDAHTVPGQLTFNPTVVHWHQASNRSASQAMDWSSISSALNQNITVNSSNETMKISYLRENTPSRASTTATMQGSYGIRETQHSGFFDFTTPTEFTNVDNSIGNTPTDQPSSYVKTTWLNTAQIVTLSWNSVSTTHRITLFDFDTNTNTTSETSSRNYTYGNASYIPSLVNVGGDRVSVLSNTGYQLLRFSTNDGAATELSGGSRSWHIMAPVEYYDHKNNRLVIAGDQDTTSWTPRILSFAIPNSGASAITDSGELYTLGTSDQWPQMGTVLYNDKYMIATNNGEAGSSYYHCYDLENDTATDTGQLFKSGTWENGCMTRASKDIAIAIRDAGLVDILQVSAAGDVSVIATATLTSGTVNPSGNNAHVRTVQFIKNGTVAYCWQNSDGSVQMTRIDVNLTTGAITQYSAETIRSSTTNVGANNWHQIDSAYNPAAKILSVITADGLITLRRDWFI